MAHRLDTATAFQCCKESECQTLSDKSEDINDVALADAITADEDREIPKI